jgi:hypothetical protein
MRFVRSIPRIGGLAELQTFECRACGVSITEAFEPKVLEMVADTPQKILEKLAIGDKATIVIECETDRKKRVTPRS